MQLTIQLRNYM